MTDWQPRDLAVCIDTGPIYANGLADGVSAGWLTPNKTYRVRSAGFHYPARETVLYLEGERMGAAARRFRKARRDGATDDLNRSKTLVAA